MIKITSKLLFKCISTKKRKKDNIKRTLDDYFLKRNKIIKVEIE